MCRRPLQIDGLSLAGAMKAVILWSTVWTAKESRFFSSFFFYKLLFGPVNCLNGCLNHKFNHLYLFFLNN